MREGVAVKEVGSNIRCGLVVVGCLICLTACDANFPMRVERGEAVYHLPPANSRIEAEGCDGFPIGTVKVMPAYHQMCIGVERRDSAGKSLPPVGKFLPSRS